MSRQRYENKFALPPWRVPMLAAWMSARLAADPEHPVGHVRTIYFDTVERRFLGQKTNSDFAKTKVRLRWYGSSRGAAAGGSAWLEVKSKTGALGDKRRVELPGLAEAADRASPEQLDLQRLHRAAIENGLRMPPLRPILALHYERRRWTDPETGSRISLDSSIQPIWSPGGGSLHPVADTLDVAICEVKGSGRELPTGLQGLGRFGARRRSFSKYYECLEQMRGA